MEVSAQCWAGRMDHICDRCWSTAALWHVFQCKHGVEPWCFPFSVLLLNPLGFLQAARMAGWLPDPIEKRFPKTSHVGFGLVLGSDGKRFRTRSTEVVRLVELLDEAKSRSKSELQQRLTENGNWTILEPYLYPSGEYDHCFCSGKIVDWSDEELEQTSEAVGYGAVKYALNISF